MKILVDALSAREGGGVTYVRQAIPALARAAAAAGHDVHVLLSSRYQHPLVEVVAPVARIREVPLPGAGVLRRLLYLQTAVPSLLRRERFDLLFTVVEVGAIRPPCPHVVMARNLAIYAPVASVTGLRARSNLLYWRATREPFARLTARGADRVVCVSEAFRELVIRRTGVPRARTEVVHHGVSPAFAQAASAASADQSGGYLLSVSSLAPHKNFERLIEAYAQLRQHGAPPPLVIAGSIADEALHAHLVGRCRALGVADHVSFRGRVPPDALPALYRGACAFVFPSMLESFGLPLVEAMASGLPVVASSLPVCREICRDAALFFDPGSTDALATSLATVLGDADVRSALVDRGRRRARDFSWDTTAARLLSIFETVGRGGPSAGAPVSPHASDHESSVSRKLV